MPNGTYGGVRGWGREAPAYSIPPDRESKSLWQKFYPDPDEED